MNQKKGNFRKAAVAVMSSVCVLTSFTQIDAKAATVTITDTTTEGYVVSATVSYDGKSVTGTGRVVSGPPCSIEVYIRGYYKFNDQIYICSTKDKIAYCISLTKTISGKDRIVKAECDVTFNDSTKVTATVW